MVRRPPITRLQWGRDRLAGGTQPKSASSRCEDLQPSARETSSPPAMRSSRTWPTGTLLTAGEDRICYGSEAFIWPHVQAYIDAFAEMEMPEELQDRYGYPELTRQIKEKIFGLNSSQAWALTSMRRNASSGWSSVCDSRVDRDAVEEALDRVRPFVLGHGGDTSG
jgi:hypothetical protein